MQSVLNGDTRPYSNTDSHNLLAYDLWSACLGLVDAVRQIYELKGKDIPRAGQRSLQGHLDIKPDNTLIGERGIEKGKLLLTDFGNCSLTRPRVGHPEYAPPDHNRTPGERYDVWSVACVLLQVIDYIDGETVSANNGHYNSRTFRDRRLVDTGRSDAAFWIRRWIMGSEVIEVRSSVKDRLKYLDAHRQLSLSRAISMLWRMFHPAEKDRPSISVVFDFLERETGSSNNVWEDSSYIGIGAMLLPAMYAVVLRKFLKPIIC